MLGAHSAAGTFVSVRRLGLALPKRDGERNFLFAALRKVSACPQCSSLGRRGQRRGIGAMFFIPGNRFDETVAETGLRLEAKCLARPAGIEAPARLTIGLGRVPVQAAAESAQVTDLFRQLTDGDFL